MCLSSNGPAGKWLWLLVILSTVSWSFGPICIRYALEADMPATLIASGRMIAGALFFTPFALRRYRGELQTMGRRSKFLAIGAGAIFAFNVTATAVSLQHISVLIAQALIATIPVWVAIMEVALLKARLPRSVWFGVFAALAGGILMARATSGGAAPIAGGNPVFGLAIASAGALSTSIYVIIGRKLRGSVAFVPYIWLVFSSASIGTLLIIALTSTPVLGHASVGYFWVLMLALLAQVIGHGTLNFVIKYLSATTATVTAQTVPALSAVWALLILSEVPTPLQALGGIALIAGVVIVLRGKIRL